MKKALLTFVLLFMGAFVLSSANLKAAVLDENPPVIGEESTTTDFYSHWQPASFGGNRIGDTGVGMALTSGFGLRAGFRTPFNLTDFEVQYDLSFINPGVAFITFFGPQGSYIGGNGATLSIEFVKHTTDANKYLIAIAPGTQAHNTSFTEFVIPDQGLWEDSAWTGFIVTAPEDVITISMVDDGTNTVVTINGTPINIESSKLFAAVPDKTSAYYLVGAINQDGSIQSAIANYVFDAARRTYYAEEGVYMTFKQNLADLEAALLEDLSVVENVQAAVDISDAMDISVLYSYDQALFTARNDAAQATLDAAVLELGGDIVLNGVETELVKLENAALLVANFATANTALGFQTSTDAKILEVDATDFSVEQIARFDALKDRATVATALVATNIKNLVVAQVDAFADAVLDLATIDLVNDALVVRNAISTNLITLLEEADQTTVNASFLASDAALQDATQELEGWILGNNTYVVAEEETVGATFLGSGLNDGNGLFYSDEKVDVRNFSMVLDIQSLTSTTGGWLSFGIMEKTEVFSTAEDSTVQENKGLFFLFIPEGISGARVEIYQMSLYSNRFFDAIKQEVLHIDLTVDVVISITTEMKTVAGVTEEYMVISIGGDTMDGETITTRSMMTSLLDYTGYLNIIGMGGTTASPNTVVVKSINGLNPNSESLVVAYTPEPLLNTTTDSYELETLDDLSLSFFSRGLDFTVELNDAVVAAANYTYVNNSLKFLGTYLETLAVGDHVFTIQTAGGSETFTLTVEAAPVEVVEEPAGMSTGAIVGIAVGSVAAIGGGAFFFLKKKKI